MVRQMPLLKSALYSLLTLPVFASAAFAAAPIRLTVDSPNSLGNLGLLPDVDAPGPLLLDRDWTLTFRAEVTNAVAYMSSHPSSDTFGDNEFIVMSDPDNCLDLRGLTFDHAPLNPLCGGPDEEILMVHTDRNDDARSADLPCPGTVALLNDREFSYTKLQVTRPAYAGDASVLASIFVGPSTGFPPGGDPPPENDCYGYGQDDDLPGLVIMADVGAARFYNEKFAHTPGAIRNMAGLLSNVTVELRDGADRTSVVASMIVRRGFFNQLVAYDADISDPAYAGVDYLRRLDGGAKEAMRYTGTRPSTSSGYQVAHALANATPYSRVQVRAVIVDGRAPDTITDLNGDGRFTAADLTAAGKRLLSNEVGLWIRVAGNSRLEDASIRHSDACPTPGPTPGPLDRTEPYSPTIIFYTDLDGNGRSGLPCTTGSSGSTIRIPR